MGGRQREGEGPANGRDRRGHAKRKSELHTRRRGRGGASNDTAFLSDKEAAVRSSVSGSDGVLLAMRSADQWGAMDEDRAGEQMRPLLTTVWNVRGVGGGVSAMAQ